MHRSVRSKISLLCLLICCRVSHAQNRDNVWILSYQSGPIYFSCGVEFNSGIADTFTVDKKLKFFITNASICDTGGNMLFYTNGLYVANRNHDTLLNSKDFNSGFWTDFYDPSGMGISQGAIAIPRPNNASKYFLFYQTGEYGEYYDKLYASLHLSVSEIDMNLDGGLGGIPDNEKNFYLIDDTLTWGRLSACKHANGRDWWLFSHKAYSNLYYKFLIQPDTILGPYEQSIGSIVEIDKFGMACFSPDGNKYAQLSYNDTLDIFDFDRCTGELSNPVKIVLPDSLGVGCSFSPNSRFLYLTQPLALYQVDMWAADIASSLMKIADYDGWTDPKAINLPSWFLMPQLAPDNKIYIGTWNSTFVFHVINQPDSLGSGCDFQQHSFPLPSPNICVPNFPNYDLGPSPGSPCDTLFNNSPVITQDFQLKLSPNPSSSLLNIEYHSNEVLQFKLFDVTGVLKKEITLYPYFSNRLLHVEDLAEGIYLAVVTSQNKIVKTEMVVVQH